MIALLLALAAAPPDYVVHGTFDSGLQSWTAIYSNPANRITVEPARGGSGSDAKLSVVKVDGRPPAWHLNLAQQNQRLTALAPATFYTLSFRARASSPRQLKVGLAQVYKSYRNLGLDAVAALDTTPRVYHISFRTDSLMSVLHEPDVSGPWLAFLADTLPGETWIGSVSITPAVAITRGGTAAASASATSSSTTAGGADTVTASTFAPEDAWKGGGRIDRAHARRNQPGLALTIPANDAAFVSRDLPLVLDPATTALVLWVWTDTPLHLGRVSLMARSGSNRDPDDVMASAAGLEAGWNRLVFPQRSFFRHWFSRFDWRHTRTVAVRIEANANGPLHITLGALDLAPAPAPGREPLQIRHVNVTGVGSRSARVICETDRPATVEVRWGATPGYGGRQQDPQPSTSHVFTLDGLSPATRYHVWLAADGASGAPAATGDFTFVTEPASSPIASAAGSPHRFDVGLYSVTSIDDLHHAGHSPFATYQTYQSFGGVANSPADVKHYLDAAESLGVSVMVGFDRDRILAGDLDYVRARVRALRSHHAIRSWCPFDEPELHGLDPAKLKAIREAIHTEDPAHPVMMGASDLGPDYAFRGTFDMALLDKSPVPFEGAGSLVPALEKARRSGEHWGFTFQVNAVDLDHRWPASGLGPARYPTFDEMRLMAYLAVNHGAEALWAFSYDYLFNTPGSEWKWTELTTIAQEVRDLAPVLGSKDAPHVRVAAVSDTALDVSLKAAGGEDYVIAANRAAHAVTARIQLAAAANSADAPTLVRVDLSAAGAAAATACAGQAWCFSDRFAPYEVHVYHVVRGAR